MPTANLSARMREEIGELISLQLAFLQMQQVQEPGVSLLSNLFIAKVNNIYLYNSLAGTYTPGTR
jgi:hypothetical protein